MDKHHKAFRTIEPDEGHPVVALSYSPSGDRFLCCTGSAQPSIWTRDGSSLLKFNRGDPYVTDMARTTGHVTIVTGGHWHPHEKMLCLTSGMDGSLRLWDLCGKTGLRDFLHCEATIRVRDKGARKCAATACASLFSGVSLCLAPAARTPAQVLAGRQEGRVRRGRRKRADLAGPRPRAQLPAARRVRADRAHAGHGRGGRGRVVRRVLARRVAARVARGRRLRPRLGRAEARQGRRLRVRRREPHGLTANLAWAANGAVLCAPAAPAARGGRGSLEFLGVGGPAHQVHKEAGGYRRLLSLGVDGGAAVCATWHDTIRHVLCGTSGGSTRVLYDPELSARGALMSVRRNHAPRHVATDATHVDVDQIVNPNALPMFRDDDAFSRKKKGGYAKLRADAVKSRLPAPPLDQGQQGRNAGARSTFCQYYVERNLPTSIRESNPRDELLKYADKEPIFRTEATFYTDKAGQRTDVADATLEEEEVAFIDDQKKLIEHRPFSAKPAPKKTS